VLERLRTFIHSHNLLTPNNRLILAVSGGLDSMVMLHLFLLSPELYQTPALVLHINHNQRGAESDKDEALVRSSCEQYGLECHSEQLTNLPKDASEDVMRFARYAVFDKMLATYSTAKLATAHHLDDQLETFLMRLAKGTSLKGLGSIPEKRAAFIRPLLGFRRVELERYQQDHQIQFRTDDSNHDVSKLRNNIRKNVVPNLMEVFSDSFYAGFDKTLYELKGRQKNLTEANERLFKSIYKMNQSNGTLLIDDYKQLPDLEKRDLLQYCVSHLDPLNYSASNEMWQSFDRFVDQAKTGKQFLISETIRVFKNRSFLEFTISDFREWPIQELFPDSSVDWGNQRITLKKVTWKDIELSADPNREFFCGDKVSFPLIIRSWKDGDIFHPFGMKGTQKVSDFYINNKIDRLEKHKIPIVIVGDKIIWIAGFRLDGRFKVTEQCKSIYKISITEEA